MNNADKGNAEELFDSKVKEFQVQLVRELLGQFRPEQQEQFKRLWLSKGVEGLTGDQLRSAYGCCARTIAKNNSKMEYNVCQTCGAKDGRAGNLFSDSGGPFECLNCRDTRKTGAYVIHLDLKRTDEEIDRTMAILHEKPE
jgi:hypothetical protein